MYVIYKLLISSSPWLWVHVTIAMLYFPLTICIMRRFSVNLKLEENGDCWSRTLMITNIPRRNSDINDMDRHFKSVFLLLLVFPFAFLYSPHFRLMVLMLYSFHSASIRMYPPFGVMLYLVSKQRHQFYIR